MMKAAGLGVDAVEAGGDAREAAAGIERLLGHLDGELGRLGEGLDRALAATLFRDPVECAFGGLDLFERGDVLAGVERLLHHLAADADEGAEQSEIIDLPRQNTRATDSRPAPGPLGHLRRAAPPPSPPLSPPTH